MEKCVLAVDVGGTSLKIALVSTNLEYVRGSFRRVLVNSNGTRDEILSAIVKGLTSVFKKAVEMRMEVTAIGMAFPGPFDYKRGISLMKHKFRSIYGVNLKQLIVKELNLTDYFPVIFRPDSWAFLVGETCKGAARGYSRVIGITIGSGLGSAFMIENKVVTRGPGVPPHGWLWNLPYKNGILEDWISRRGIIKMYREATGSELDVKEIADRAYRGEKYACTVFERIGRILGGVLRSIARDFRAECIVLGGQISRAFNLFERPLREELRNIGTLKKVAKARYIDLAPIYGITKMTLDYMREANLYPEEE